MLLRPSDPDLRTLTERIDSGELDLQPEFQRGEVWGELKRQRLIDSILRDWQIPPIHIVVDPETNKQSVLDGQQRLAAIRDFIRGTLTINSRIEPAAPELQGLDGLTYKQLPPEWQRRVDRYSVRVFYISDYRPEEPGELFFRLNQNSALSPAEQRNAFFGTARRQVKALVDLTKKQELEQTFFGFSNARMAYDDLLARALLLVDCGTLRTRVSASALVSKYRETDGFSRKAVGNLRETISYLGESANHLQHPEKQNKATVLSWVVFSNSVRSTVDIPAARFGIFMNELLLAQRFQLVDHGIIFRVKSAPPWSAYALSVYEDRATSRVADVTSVVLRDLVLWMHFVVLVPEIDWSRVNGTFGERVRKLRTICEGIDERLEPAVLAETLGWGRLP